MELETDDASAYCPKECIQFLEGLDCEDDPLPKQVVYTRNRRLRTANANKEICIEVPVTSAVVDAFANPCSFDDTSSPTSPPHKLGSKSNRNTIPPVMLASTLTSGSSSTATETSDSDDEPYYANLRPSPASSNYLSPRDRECLRNDLPVRPKPPPSCDLIVSIGEEYFFYSSGILKHTSNYLSSRYVTRDHDGRCYIRFPDHSPEDWRPFIWFLQSHLVGAANLSWTNFPVILPWFLEFEMIALLRDADKFLLNEAVACQLDMRDNHHNFIVPILLLLTNVSFSSGLKLTKTRARVLLKAKVVDPQGMPHGIGDHEPSSDDGASLQWSLQDLQLLSEILLKFEDLREDFWESCIIMYLPQDLNVTDSSALLGNPLFPYLLREGMMQIVEARKAEGALDDTSKWSFRSSSTARTSSLWSESTMPTINYDKVMGEMQERRDLLKNNLQMTMGNIERFQRLQKVSQDSSQDPRNKGRVSPRETDVESQPSDCTNSAAQPMVWVNNEGGYGSSGCAEFRTNRRRQRKL